MEQIQVSLLIKQLESKGLVKGTRVSNYKGLIMEWAKRKVKFPSQRYMLKGIMDELRTSRMKYALTTYHAETLVNGYLFPTKTEVYIREYDFDQWHNALVKLGAMVGGGNITLKLYDDGVFYNSFTTKDGYTIVSIPQLIVDLVREGGVAMQAAEILIQKHAKSSLESQH